ncbi:O-acetylhomoserine sulfhydrylase / O-succinylhomoserine sulfhydrylase [Pseudonocardia sp. Ae406_Ps2]|uniref:O-acetylhomoserine aminocarboxypropyltransferase/cysteine synthase family protein n=1 Tax=unclassified Pseudonocardia TaxID=2619320 RepID=UPI00094B027B|nr:MULTISPECIES: aminotransferase class I/II-fold pyridoxal phosphate-dependent enzyme [unclassified Pseudonocardia]OLM01299.1 O-acetylhomoserine sulfhydrylase / O-succinylhomoserine sulfhydrylase [Pseudonocardia sp. Ae406_Ps2]OLM06904.1 O-acetylhomoserine sulfhydrylase / O-succinylhomoserine sulfhydrylase [Pseudonocardia sp. Ae331_Ps2]OLM14080.1 O-acetylhomoserine sulfhydrylase / O-succinylhomoserine sulfhydrylase [Pseudonocardia sp. Ae505_Ps2]OLM22872.1 O-acetylhomoserine sulfhydrylase / O-su
MTSFATRQLHAGAVPDPATGARAVPIYQTTSYRFTDSAHAAAAFALEDLESHAYTRLSNPTTAVVEERLAALEGGAAAVAVSSGQAATSLALLNLARAGDHVVAAASLYGGTHTLLSSTFADLGISVTFVEDPDDLDQWRSAITARTRALFGESIGNPLGNVLDLAGVAAVAHQAGLPFVVDNTVPTPYLLRPIEHGADVIVHSTTKFLAGHGTAIGGIVVDSGRFDFGRHPDLWPGLTAPDPTYGGLSFHAQFGPLAYALRLRTRLLRDLGPAPSPFNGFLLLQGIETLDLRLARHVENTQAVAEFLEAHPAVEAVHYPGLPSSRWFEAGRRYLPAGAGAIVAFEIRGGREAGARFVDGLRLFTHLANIGDVRSLAIHPASTTHAQLDPAAQLASGVTPGLVRLSVGIEGIADLRADLEHALEGRE